MHILFEDHHLLVVSKPAPLLTQAPEGIPSLEAMVKAYIKEKYAKPAGVYLGVPHRLDRPVSGVVLFARNTKAAARIAEQFQKHLVRKIYWAIVSGKPSEESGRWEDYLRKHPEESRSEVVEATTLGAKLAITHYQILQRREHTTWMQLSPQTGRMHQLRLQASSRGLPIVGDELYGSPISFGPPAVLPRDRMIGLHARSLTFEHPFRKESMTLEAPIPESWQEFDVGPRL